MGGRSTCKLLRRAMGEMVHEITNVTVEMSDGRRYSLAEAHISRLFGGNNPISTYLAVAFSPDIDGGGWVEEKESKGWDGL
jgi:hypothetical protein